MLHGGGALKSTLGDMLKYVSMYLNEGKSQDGTQVIDRDSIEEMCRPRQIVKPGVYYGYGLEMSQMEDMVLVEHGGSLPGVSSNLCFCPQKGIGVIVLCNTMDVPVYSIGTMALRLYCGLPLEAERIEHMPRSWSEDEKRELAGDYISGEGDRFSIKELENGELSMKVNGTPIEMKSVYPWQGMVRKKYSDVYLTAFRDENGTVFAARYGSRIFPKA